MTTEEVKAVIDVEVETIKPSLPNCEWIGCSKKAILLITHKIKTKDGKWPNGNLVYARSCKKHEEAMSMFLTSASHNPPYYEPIGGIKNR